MTSELLNNYFLLQLESDREEKFLTSGVTWQDYELLLESLGNSSSYRIAYLSKTLEIISPSRSHELDKENIGRLLEAYLEEKRIRFWGLGSTTLRSPDKQAGKEPDKCYCIDTDKDIPDLAIEVIYTSGGVDILEIYRRLGVREVWFWQNNQFKIYCLQDNNYRLATQSQLLPNLNLALLAGYVTIKDPLDAVIQWRDRVRVS
jgi:Uma2 family endonuclease